MDGATEGEKRAGHRPRRCTDVLCIPIFFAAIGVLLYIVRYASIHGDMARVYHGIDFHNNLCGVSETVQDKPFLFWCAKPGAAMTEQAMQEAGITDNPGAAVMTISSLLDLAHPICVASCPAGTSTYHSCYQSETATNGPPDPDGSFTQTIRYDYDLVADHATSAIAERYCIPHTMNLLEQLTSTLSGGAEGLMFHAAQVLEHWHLVAAAAVLAVLLGYTYLFLVKTLARPLIYMTFAVSSLACLAFGGYMLFGVYRERVEATFAAHFDVTRADVDAALISAANTTSDQILIPSTGDRRADTVIAIVLLVIGAGIAIAACCLRRSIDIVMGSLAATLECLQDMPIMLLQPLISVVIRAVFVSIAFAGFIWVLSIGDVSAYHAGGMVPSGFARTFTYTEEQQWCIGGYVLITLWMLEFGSALEQFVFIYGTQMWFFAPYGTTLGMKRKSVSQCGIARGAFLGLTYHLGTLAFGSIILAIVRSLYFVLSIIYKQAKKEGGDNAVVDATAGCCLCCLQCWERIIRYLNKMAYIVVSINSENFCSAAETMVEIVASQFAALGLLEGATKVFQVGGVVTITSSGGYLAWLVLTKVHAFTGPESPHFVAQPEWVAAAAAGACLIIAGVFMDVFDTVSDTILFCWALDKKNRKEQGLPPNTDLPSGLAKLLQAADIGEERQPMIRR